MRAEALRTLVQQLRDYYTADDSRFHIDHPICDEAADAIERLIGGVQPCKCPSCGASFLPWVPVDPPPDQQKGALL